MRNDTSDLLLRLGAAFAFLYPPLDALLNPYTWVGYIPAFLTSILPGMVILHVFGLVEVILAVWILSGRRIFVPCLIATAMLLAIVVFNLRDFEVLFRDLSIAALTLGLGLMHRTSHTKVV